MSPDPSSVLTPEIRQRMVEYARRLMSEQLKRKHDPESAAQSALASASEEKNADIWAKPADEILRILLVKTRYHVLDRVARVTAQKRDLSREVGELPEGAAADAPDPQAAAEWKDFWAEIRARLGELGREYGVILDRVAEGHSTADIAGELQVSTATIQRRLKDIREVVRALLEQPGS